MQLDKVFLKLIWEQPDNYKQKKKTILREKDNVGDSLFHI